MLFVVCWLLFTDRCSMSVVLLPVVRCCVLLFVACSVLFVGCKFLGGCSLLLVVVCFLFCVVRRLLFLGWCMLFVRCLGSVFWCMLLVARFRVHVFVFVGACCLSVAILLKVLVV